MPKIVLFCKKTELFCLIPNSSFPYKLNSFAKKLNLLLLDKLISKFQVSLNLFFEKRMVEEFSKVDKNLLPVKVLFMIVIMFD